MVASWDSIGAKLYRWTMTMKLRYAVSWPSPEQLSLVRVQFEPASGHPATKSMMHSLSRVAAVVMSSRQQCRYNCTNRYTFMLLYNGLLLCGFHVPVKGLNSFDMHSVADKAAVYLTFSFSPCICDSTTWCSMCQLLLVARCSCQLRSAAATWLAASYFALHWSAGCLHWCEWGPAVCWHQACCVWSENGHLPAIQRHRFAYNMFFIQHFMHCNVEQKVDLCSQSL